VTQEAKRMQTTPSDTPAEHATGYTTTLKELMHHSWQSFLIDQLRYADWIDRGRTRPTHSEWSQYLQ
jgi:hypothetical protein